MASFLLAVLFSFSVFAGPLEDLQVRMDALKTEYRQTILELVTGPDDPVVFERATELRMQMLEVTAELLLTAPVENAEKYIRQAEQILGTLESMFHMRGTLQYRTQPKTKLERFGRWAKSLIESEETFVSDFQEKNLAVARARFTERLKQIDPSFDIAPERLQSWLIRENGCEAAVRGRGKTTSRGERG